MCLSSLCVYTVEIALRIETLPIEILPVTSEWAWPAFLHGKRLKTAHYSEAKEGARQQTSTTLVFYGRLHFPSVTTLKKDLYMAAASCNLATN